MGVMRGAFRTPRRYPHLQFLPARGGKRRRAYADSPAPIRPTSFRRTLRRMQTRTPIITRHKLARLFAWAQLWLVGFVAACVARNGAVSRRGFDRVARLAQTLIMVSALAHGTGGRPTRNRHGRKKHVTCRIFIGSRLRAATRGKTWAARIFAILALIRDADRHVRRLLRRLRRGLTRLRVLLPRSESCALASAPLCVAAHADTS